MYAGLEDRDIFLGNLSHSAVPSADFFTLSILSGLLFSAGLFFHASPLFILAVLTAPFLAPLAGLSLATVSGSGRFFFHSLGGLLVSVIFVFLTGAVGGLASRLWAAPDQNALISAVLFNWADIAVLLAGAVFTSLRLYRNPLQNPRLAGAALAYELFLPVVIAAFGLSAGYPQILQAGLSALVLRLSLAVLVSAVVFDLQGLRLRLRENSSFSGSILLTAFISILFLAAGSFTRGQIPALREIPPAEELVSVSQQLTPTVPAQPAQETEPVIAATVTPTTAPTHTPSQEIRASVTRTPTPKPTITETATITPEPIPYLAVVKVSGAAGAYIREEPAGAVVSSVLNDAWVEVQPQHAEETVNDTVWVFIRTDEGVEGWMMKSLLDIRSSTPAP